MANVLHTRLRFLPSGPVHIGHVALGLLGVSAAEATGGTFCIRCTHLKASRATGRWANYRKHVERNLDDLAAAGIDASPPEVFCQHGMNPRWRAQRQDEVALTDHYWHDLGFDKLWGEWPCADSPDPTNEWHSMILGHYEQGWCHPYIRLAQVVGDVTTGRNCIFRGDDHLQDGAITNAFAHAVAMRHYRLTEVDRVSQYVPDQYFLPKLQRASGVVLASGNPGVTEGLYVKDFLKTKLPPERLFRFLERVLFRTEAEASALYTGWSRLPVEVKNDEFGNPLPPVQEGATKIMASIRREPVVDDLDWARFLRTGEVPEWEGERRVEHEETQAAACR